MHTKGSVVGIRESTPTPPCRAFLLEEHDIGRRPLFAFGYNVQASCQNAVSLTFLQLNCLYDLSFHIIILIM